MCVESSEKFSTYIMASLSQDLSVEKMPPCSPNCKAQAPENPRKDPDQAQEQTRPERIVGRGPQARTSVCPVVRDALHGPQATRFTCGTWHFAWRMGIGLVHAIVHAGRVSHIQLNYGVFSLPLSSRGINFVDEGMILDIPQSEGSSNKWNRCR